MRKRQYKEKRPKRLGAMQVERTRHTEPSYFRVLFAAGLIERTTDIQNAWGLWQRICADEAVVMRSRELAAQDSGKPFHLTSISAPFQNGAQTLASMNEKQIAALRERHSVNLS